VHVLGAAEAPQDGAASSADAAASDHGPSPSARSALEISRYFWQVLKANEAGPPMPPPLPSLPLVLYTLSLEGEAPPPNTAPLPPSSPPLPSSPQQRSTQRSSLASKQAFAARMSEPSGGGLAGAGLAGVRAAIDVGGPTETQWGVLKAWSWGLLHVAKAVPELGSLDPTRVAAVGHSRRGKVVLLAAAMDRGADAPLITLAVAHQSGTAGARLSRSDDGGEHRE
jgi:hypothetical protein